MKTRRRLIRASAALIGLVLWGAFQPSWAVEPSLKPEQAAQIRRILVAWLECEECNHGELRAVVRLGPVVLRSLAASLKEGPSPASRESLRRHLIATYRGLKKSELPDSRARVTLSEADYVNIYLDNYIALYQIRAAKALAGIGGPEAKKVLKEALQMSIRSDVLAAIQSYLREMH